MEKRDYRKFFTYPDTAKFMATLLNPNPGDFVLEPSAGNGALVRAVKNESPESTVCAIELYEEFRDELKAVADIVVIKDFLEVPTTPKFSSCIANPPFGNGIDLQAHFDRIRAAVKVGGKIVILLPADFDVQRDHAEYPVANWSTNSDGTTTPIKIIQFIN